MFGSKTAFIIKLFIFFSLGYFAFWWLYKLSLLPGLHGDEAWFGLTALSFADSGADRLAGMNNYTGIIQPLIDAFAFKYFGRGVFQLRLVGVAFNFIGLLAILWFFRDQLSSVLAFFILISQSVFFMISPRVAWEVNSFTLFFISLLLLTLRQVVVNNKQHINSPHAFAFLLVNIVGSYNHVIFSCISLASLIGLAVWSIHANSLKYKQLIILGIINAINLSGLYFVMTYYLDVMFPVWGYVLTGIILILTVEVFFLKKLAAFVTGRPGFSFPKAVPYCLLAIFCGYFTFLHGTAFFKLLSNGLVLTHFFSYEPNSLQYIIYLIAAAVYLLALCWCLIKDIFYSDRSIFAWIIVAYMWRFRSI